MSQHVRKQGCLRESGIESFIRSGQKHQFTGAFRDLIATVVITMLGLVVASYLNLFAKVVIWVRQLGTQGLGAMIVGAGVAGVCISVFAVRRWIELNRESRNRECAETKLRLSQFAADHAEDGIFWVTSDARIINVNHTACRMLGYSREELLEMCLTDVVFLPALRQWEDSWTLLKTQSSEPVEARCKSRTGQIITIDLAMSHIEFEGREFVGAMIRDITYRKKSEQAIRESEEKFRTVFQANPDPVAITSVDEGILVDVNDGFLARTGYSREKIIGKTVFDFKLWNQPGDRHNVIQSLREEGYVNNFQAGFRSKDGNIRTGLISVRMITLGGKKYVLSVLRDIEDWKRAERDLWESKNVLRQVIDLVPIMIYAKDAEGRFVLGNKAIAEVHGTTPTDLVNKTCGELIGDREEYHKYLRDDREVIFSGLTKVIPEETFTYPDGRKLWLRTTKMPIKLPGQESDCVLGVSVDITNSKEYEEALKEVNARIEALVQAIPDVIYFKDAQGRNLIVNKAFEELVHMPRSAVVGKTDKDLFPADLAEKCYLSDLQALAGRKIVRAEEKSIGENGDVVYFDTIKVPLYDKRGDVMGLVGISRDITERKRFEQSLRKLSGAVENSPASVVIVDTRGNVEYINPRFTETTGYTSEDILGKSWDVFRFIKDKPIVFPERVQRVINAGMVWHGERESHRKNGQAFWCRLSVSGVRNEEGVLTHYILMMEDITDRRAFERELFKVRKLESLGILAGGIAHDFNNILTGILGNIALARIEGEDRGDISEVLAEAEKAAMRAQNLTQQLLTFSKGGEPVRSTTSVAELITDSVPFALHGSNVCYELNIADDLRPARIDSGQISQVLHNLVINADQAMPGGGRLIVTAENVSIDTSSSRPLAPGEYVKISIEDNGTGISQVHLARIFDPYFTTKPTGNGLGLAISFSIVKKHGGHIEVTSEIGKGTTFHIYLPAEDERQVVRANETEREYRGAGRILVMDDEYFIRDLLSRILTRLGYDVICAADGDEALDLFARAVERGEDFDLVILDLTVPGGVGGKEIIGDLRKIRPQLKALVSSGYSNNPVMAQYREYGFDGVMAKPYRPVELSKTIHELIGTVGDKPSTTETIACQPD